jgi:hypothetical protein
MGFSHLLYDYRQAPAFEDLQNLQEDTNPLPPKMVFFLAFPGDENRMDRLPMADTKECNKSGCHRA